MNEDQTTISPPKPGRKADPAKDAAILAAARASFLELPYDRVSMDMIAARAGVSKVTIYAKYQSKEGLFIATINEQCSAIYQHARSSTRLGGSLDVALSELGIQFMSMILSPEMASLHGIMIQAAQDKPELTQRYFESVVETSIATLAETLDIAVARGIIECLDTRRAAVQFIAMIQGNYRYEHELGLGTQVPPQALAVYVNECVKVFVRGHRP